MDKPSQIFWVHVRLRHAVALTILFGLISLYIALGPSYDPSGKLQLALSFGVLFGFILQRSRFCFFCLWRDWLDHRDPRGILGLILALGIGIAGYTLVYGAWLPNPFGPRLPPTAHIGPVSIITIVAGLLFGAGMAISGSCVSAHLYRLGEGSPTAPFALIGTIIGFWFGFTVWNPIYLNWIFGQPALWLPNLFGYSGALCLAFVTLVTAAVLVSRQYPYQNNIASTHNIWNSIFVGRWPSWVGGLLIGGLGTAAYFRLSPLGVTAEIGSRARQSAQWFGLLPERLEGLDVIRGCATIVGENLLTPNGMFVLALVLSSLAAALISGAFQPIRPTRGHALRGTIGGILLGLGSMLGFGCTIGTVLSGISAGALSGWLFLFALLVGSAFTLKLGRQIGWLAPP